MSWAIVRALAWLFVVCAVLGAVGLALPALTLRTPRGSVVKPPGVSMLQLAASRHRATRVVAVVQGSRARDVALALVDSVAGRSASKLHATAADVRGAVVDVGRISASDVSTAGTTLAVAVWGWLAMLVAMALLVFGDVVSGHRRRRRMLAAAALAAITTALAIGWHLALRLIVDEVADAAGTPLVQLGAGAYVTLVASIAGLLALLAVLVLARRERSAQSSPPSSPPPS